jgi:hypothetical protein
MEEAKKGRPFALCACSANSVITSSIRRFFPTTAAVASILSVVESGRRLKFPERDYLAAILPGLADLPSGARVRLPCYVR